MTPQTRLPISALLALVLVTIGACGTGSPDEATTPVAAGQSTSTQESEQRQSSSSPVPTTTTPKPLSDDNSVLVWKDNGEGQPYEVGTVSVETGEYTKVSSFPAAANVPEEDGPGARLSPDLQRLAAGKQVASRDYVGGWYTADGYFVQATPSMQKTDFSPEQQVDEEAFDYQGRFYYSVHVLGGYGRTVYKLENGEIGVGEQQPDVTYHLPYILPDGSPAPPESCVSDDDVYSLVTATGRYLQATYDAEGSGSTSTNTQIYTGDISTLPSTGSCGPVKDSTKLLPSTNTASVSQPVATKDGKRVAFLYSESSQPTKLYTTDIAGGGNPILVGNDGFDWTGWRLLQWRS